MRVFSAIIAVLAAAMIVGSTPVAASKKMAVVNYEDTGNGLQAVGASLQ